MFWVHGIFLKLTVTPFWRPWYCPIIIENWRAVWWKAFLTWCQFGREPTIVFYPCTSPLKEHWYHGRSGIPRFGFVANRQETVFFITIYHVPFIFLQIFLNEYHCNSKNRDCQQQCRLDGARIGLSKGMTGHIFDLTFCLLMPLVLPLVALVGQELLQTFKVRGGERKRLESSSDFWILI